jgi:hypothetical protein
MTTYRNDTVATFVEDGDLHAAIRRDSGWKDGQWQVAIHGFRRVTDEFIAEHGTIVHVPPTAKELKMPADPWEAVTRIAVSGSFEREVLKKLMPRVSQRIEDIETALVRGEPLPIWDKSLTALAAMVDAAINTEVAYDRARRILEEHLS